MEHFVYILLCDDGSFYKGMTSNIETRYCQHLLGKCQATKNKYPQLAFVQICENRLIARSLEKYLKSGAGREIISSIT